MASTFAFLPGAPGPFELMILAGIILLLFGGSKLPKLMRGVGQGITEFKKGIRGIEDDIDEAVNRPIESPKKEEPVASSKEEE